MTMTPLKHPTSLPCEIDIQIEHPGWNEFAPNLNDHIKKAVLAALSGAKMSGTCELSILLTSDDDVQQLNKDFRGKNSPTNVLSFPALEQQELDHLLKSTLSIDPTYLGDIALAYQTVLKEAEEQNKSPINHLTHLLIHGTLHLIGYDHENDDDANEMESLEIEILSSTFNINNPYEDK